MTSEKTTHVIRVLVIDDTEQPDVLEQMKRELEGGFSTTVELEHLNPTPFFKGEDAEHESDHLLEKVRQMAAEFWDVAIIDLNLREVELPVADRLHLSLEIAKAFREMNRCAIIILYSGALHKYVQDLLADPQHKPETTLRSIYDPSISGFVSRSEVSNAIYSALEEVPWLLRLDRLFAKYSSIIAVEESEFFGKSFGELANAVRQQNALGQRVSQQVTEFGVAAFAELNK